MLSTQLNDAHFIVLASFDSREEITVQSIYCYAACGCVFKNGARTYLFFSLKAPASICKNSLLVTRGFFQRIFVGAWAKSTEINQANK